MQVCPILKRYPSPTENLPHCPASFSTISALSMSFLSDPGIRKEWCPSSSSSIHKSGTETTHLYFLRAFLQKQNKTKLTPLHTKLVASEFCSRVPDFYCRSVICGDVNNWRRRKSGMTSSFLRRGLLQVSHSQWLSYFAGKH